MISSTVATLGRSDRVQLFHIAKHLCENRGVFIYIYSLLYDVIFLETDRGIDARIELRIQGLVAEDFEHGFMTLLFGKQLCGVFPILVFVDDDVLRGGNKAVLYAAVTT